MQLANRLGMRRLAQDRQRTPYVILALYAVLAQKDDQLHPEIRWSAIVPQA